MARFSINLRDLVILVADPSSYMSMLIHSMLRGFGGNKVLEARSSTSVLQVLTNQKIDILISDSLPPRRTPYACEMITPPIGLNCFIVARYAGRPVGEVFKGTFPHFIAHLVAIAILVAFRK